MYANQSFCCSVGKVFQVAVFQVIVFQELRSASIGNGGGLVHIFPVAVFYVVENI